MSSRENVVILFAYLEDDDSASGRELSAVPGKGPQPSGRRSELRHLNEAVTANEGRTIKYLDSGLMASFRSVSSALTCAVSMQQLADAAERRAENAVSLGLRIGVSVGEAALEEDDYFGDPVIEAARLCAKASGGQILAVELAKHLAGRRGSFSFGQIGPLLLRGIPEPVDTVEVNWDPLSEVPSEGSGIPLPAALGELPEIGRVMGRQHEEDLLLQAFKRSAAGDGRNVVMLSGEPGVGKSTLVAWLARQAHELGAAVLFGHCDEEIQVGYQAFAEALGHYVTHVDESLLRAHIDAEGPELALMVPRVTRRLGALPSRTDQTTERHLLFSSVVGLCSRASQLQPLVLILDDLQWSDLESLHLLRHLISESEEMRLMVITTYRPQLPNTHPLLQILASLRREHGVNYMSLEGFDEAGVVAFIESAAGHSLPEELEQFASVIFKETDGNPFFVSEVLRHLSETGVLYQGEGGQWQTRGSLEALTLPQSVRQVIGARIARLGDAAVKILSVAAVAGREFELPLLVEVAGQSEDDLVDLLAEATEAALVQEATDCPGRYRFAHALIAHTLYQELGPTRRARAHRKVAEALERLCADELRISDMEQLLQSQEVGRYGDRVTARVAQLAYHWSKTALRADLPRAIAYCKRAGEQALANLAPEDAARWFSMALVFEEQLDDSDHDEELDLRIGLGTAQRHSGLLEHRETLLTAAKLAKQHGSPHRIAAALMATNEATLPIAAGHVDTEKIALLEAGLASVPATDHSTRALLLATLCGERTFRSSLDLRLELANEARVIANAGDDPVVRIQVVNRVQAPLEVAETLDDRLRETAECLELAEVLGDPALIFWTTWLRSVTVMQAGQSDELDRCMALLSVLTEELGLPDIRWLTALRRSAVAALHGDHGEAEQLAARALELGLAIGAGDAGLLFAAQFFMVRWMQGRLDELVDATKDAVQANPDIPALASTLALLNCEIGRKEESLELLRSVAADRFQSIPNDPARLVALCGYAETAAELDQQDVADCLLQLLTPLRNQVAANLVMVAGPVEYFIARLEMALRQYAAAETAFLRAEAVNAALRARYFQAQNDLQLGSMLLRRCGPGDAESGCERLRNAYQAGTRHGYAGIARRAGDYLEAVGP